ncbi:hypothetical protein [Qipengyuania sp.]|uniref:hypothetical protein n=1 Tax=Qipengyuania sp. TaxID=2004515 RepID=UPI003519B0BF
MAARSIEQLLSEQQSALDGVLNEVSLGIRNQRQFDELEERATAIAFGVRDAFRKGRR